ncbi:hypothetical protein DO021_18920 [Desulfobacter hydrogenophilus]|uniref:Uncharacterized protein n=1 Tax=Desulfobacter hydrogenophilus TaxID=2291 RepID=A0A328F7B7_9BACT|nr:hypothetical protein [Desulfobacter hydrogenophilus]NDY73840.1 hypothetical protein [Desulfobacter hydrogenophilus]QBH13149.1 hypothetical protein EYB58_09600 [Desulfobacter hydrogenophilus]RAM00458.1 hypothetical protein DO021_18920 [Desulfobacter hydrogenophilus]
MGNNDLISLFQAWLEIPEVKAFIDKLIVSVHQKMKMSKLPLSGLSPETIDPDDIRQELMAFLLEDKCMMSDLVNRRPGAMAKIRQFLWQRLIDKSREKEGNQDIHKDTWRLFYRHILAVLGDSGDFFKTKAPPKKTLLSMSEEIPGTFVMGEDLLSIEFPGQMTTIFEQLNTKKNILSLARYFWGAAAGLADDPAVRIDILDFMTWTSQHVVLRFQTESHPVSGGDVTLNNPVKNAPGHEDTWDKFKKSMISTWACNFYNFLGDEDEERDRKLFFYYECKDFTHKEVAKLMDKESHHSYRRGLIREKLKTFLRALNWVSPEYDADGQDPGDFKTFLFHLCRKLSSEIGFQEAS